MHEVARLEDILRRVVIEAYKGSPCSVAVDVVADPGRAIIRRKHVFFLLHSVTMRHRDLRLLTAPRSCRLRERIASSRGKRGPVVAMTALCAVSMVGFAGAPHSLLSRKCVREDAKRTALFREALCSAMEVVVNIVSSGPVEFEHGSR